MAGIIFWCCDDCGMLASELTYTKKHKKKPLDPTVLRRKISTYHTGKCNVCGCVKAVTEVRDFNYPDFSLLGSTSYS